MDATLKQIVVLSEVLPLGGTSTFVLNLCAGLESTNGWRGAAAGLRETGDLGKQIRDAGLRMFSPPAGSLLHEERIESIYGYAKSLSARAVVAGLGSGSFDFLRYVPQGCLRIGIIQSDDACVYDLVERYLPWLDIICGVSLEICRKMELRLTGRRVPVVHQPYGVPFSDEIPPHRNIQTMKVLYLGRIIEEQKRVRLMSRVMKLTLEQNPNIQWTIAGAGPDLEMMKTEFAADADRIRFLGGIPYHEVPHVVASHDVYFLCSDYEGLPLSLLESMGAGLVPVVSDLASGISEVVNDSNGIRIPIHDEVGYSNALLKLAAEPELRMSMSRNASAEVRESHSTHAMASRWERMLDTHLPDKLPIWPPTCRATTPMELDGQWRFSPALRSVRKLLKRLRG